MKRWEGRDARHSPAKRCRRIKFNCTRKGEVAMRLDPHDDFCDPKPL